MAFSVAHVRIPSGERAARVPEWAVEGSVDAMAEAPADLRRYPRCRAAWTVIVDTPGRPPRTRRTVDFGPFGVKVRLPDRLRHGAPARLRLSTPDRRALLVNAIVWRSDPDGHVFVFVGVSPDDLARMKGLVDSHRGA